MNHIIIPLPHFSGNFWWANSFQIKKLPLLQNYDSYYEAEMWLCNTKAKYVSLHQSPVNHHISRYHWSCYENIIPLEVIQFDT